MEAIITEEESKEVRNRRNEQRRVMKQRLKVHNVKRSKLRKKRKREVEQMIWEEH